MKSIGDLIRTAHGLWDVIETGGEAAKRLVELETGLLAAKGREAALIEENSALKQQVADMQQFDEDAQHYQPCPKADGAWTMRLKAEHAEAHHPADPRMDFCAQCFLQRQLSILQPFEKPRSGCRYLRCQCCGTEVRLDEPPKSQIDFC